MSKMIMFWKSNAKTELGFYGVDNKNKTHLSEAELNINIAEAFAEAGDDDEHEELLNEKSTEPPAAPPAQLTVNGEPIPRDNCIVLIEDIWIDKYVDLSHDLIVDEIGEVPVDVMDDDESNHSNEESENNKDDNNGEKDVLDYNVDDLVNEFIN